MPGRLPSLRSETSAAGARNDLVRPLVLGNQNVDSSEIFSRLRRLVRLTNAFTLITL
jgi:hypothetical protein